MTNIINKPLLGLYGKPVIDLEKFVDMKSFDELQLDIVTGIAISKYKVNHGFLLNNNAVDRADMSVDLKFTMLDDAYKTFLSLPNDDPVKIRGDMINNEYGYNAFVVYLKYIYGAHDLMSYYQLWDFYPGWRTNLTRNYRIIADDFKSLIAWIDKLITDNIFEKIGRAYLLAVESNGYSFEHRDPRLDPDMTIDEIPEFIHFRPDLKRPFYVYEHDTNTRHYLSTRASWWNDRDLHGGEPIMEPTYAIRIDGVFTKEFREKIKNQ